MPNKTVLPSTRAAHTNLAMPMDGQQLTALLVRDMNRRKALEASIRKADELYDEAFKALGNSRPEKQPA